ncbi:MAG: hypothetical protein LBD59_06320 [Prevotellaceae bacterium]|jgi:hypothetical protein|nr:hypothetical protein [Prevotellaceae bacterium]
MNNAKTYYSTTQRDTVRGRGLLLTVNISCGKIPEQNINPIETFYFYVASKFKIQQI